jgi:hypothetical protein
MSKGSRTNSTLAPERYSATKPLARFSSAPEICPLHFTVEWAPVFSRKTGKNTDETGSYVTASATTHSRPMGDFLPPTPLASPSRLLLRFAESFSRQYPVLDAGSGVGRNAIALAKLGHTVVCADRDYQHLGGLVPNIQLIPICIDLGPATWPFGRSLPISSDVGAIYLI